jgi:uncharacterized protein YlxW (UPF0749 family)
MKGLATALTVSAALLLWGVFGAARAQEAYEPSAAAAAQARTPFFDEERERQAAARALAERRQRMIDECQQNHGSEIDCEHETDTELRAEGLPWRTRIGAGAGR